MRVFDSNPGRTLRFAIPKVFGDLTALHDINLEESGIQSHNSIGIGDRYLNPLHDTFRKLKIDHFSMQRRLLLAFAIKAMNVTLGPEGTVPSALVFGEFPSLKAFAGPVIPRPSLAERAEISREARRHMSKSLAQSRIRRTIQYQTPPATERSLFGVKRT